MFLLCLCISWERDISLYVCWRQKFLVSSPQDCSKCFYTTSLADLFTQTPSQLLWEASSYMLQLICEDCSYTYPPLSVARYSITQQSELEQCRVKQLAQGFNTAAQDLNSGPLSRESDALLLSHYVLCRLLRIESEKWWSTLFNITLVIIS